jgi:5-methylcytosine-specific restriction endonuclease McrA
LTTRTHTRAGSVFQRSSDGMWTAAIEIFNPYGTKRSRKVFYSKQEETVRVKLAEFLAENPPRPMYNDMQDYRHAARARATHTQDERFALWEKSTECPICGTRLNAFNKTRDHIQAVSEGGDDSIENLQYLCWECNTAKSKRSRLAWDGPPRPFRALPRRRKIYEEFLATGGDPYALTVSDVYAMGMRIR